MGFKCSCQGLIINSLLLLFINPLLAQSAPDRTEIRRITRNRETNVQRHISRWEVARPDQVLGQGNWMATGRNSMAWMWYNTIDVIYRQTQNTFSQFIPRSTCGFQVSSGGNLFLSSGSRGCYQILGNFRVRPPSAPNVGLVNPLRNGDRVPTVQALHSQLSKDLTAQDNSETEATDSSAVAFFLFRNQEEQETVVGVLASPLGAVVVESREDNAGPVVLDDIETDAVTNQIELDAGEFVFILDDGRFVKGEFSLENFYENNPLALGLGPSSEDQAYVDQLTVEDEKTLFTEIRAATLQALAEQPEAGPFETINLDEFSLSGLGNPVSLPSPPECQAVFVDEGQGFACFF